MNTFPFICRSRGRCLVNNLSYCSYISFILSPLPYNITYPSWFATSYDCPSFMVLVWSYHWQFKYPFASVSLQEWTYNNPLWDIVVVIILKSGTHVEKEVSHLFFCHTQRQVNILITRNDFQTLMDIVIIDQTFTYMVQWTSTTSHETMMAIQKKTRSCAKQAPGDDFTPFIIKMYGCFHSCFDSFLTTCAQTIIVHHQRYFLVPIRNACP